MRFSFGLGLPVVQQVPGRTTPWESSGGADDILLVAHAAERAGYRWVACSDHVLVPSSRVAAMSATWYEPAATLAFVAGATERIGLLSHVLVLPYRHPLATAKTWGTLDRLSKGRVILGVGSGHLRPEFRILGVPFERRAALTDEAIGAIRAAWRDDVAAYDGTCVSFRDVMISPRPFRPGGPPIWVGGNGRLPLRRAAALGDGWIPWEIGFEEFREAVRVGESIREADRRRGRFEWIAPLRVGGRATIEELRDEIDRWRDAGATGCHVGFESRSVEEHVDRLGWFADEFVNPDAPL